MDFSKSRKDFIDSVEFSMANHDWNKHLEDIVFVDFPPAPNLPMPPAGVPKEATIWAINPDECVDVDKIKKDLDLDFFSKW